MKKINSIWYGGTILGIGLIFAIIVPVIIYYILPVFSMKLDLNWVIRISIAIGILILLFFSIMLVIELNQDKRMNRFFEKNKYRKIELHDGTYECQNCGNRLIESDNTSCNLCGIKFLK